MNERIKELAKQAQRIIEHDYPDHLPETVDLADLILDTFADLIIKECIKEAADLILDTFADLIIKECIKEAMEEIVSDEAIAEEYDPMVREYLKGNNSGITDAVIRLRNHFGVTD